MTCIQVAYFSSYLGALNFTSNLSAPLLIRGINSSAYAYNCVSSYRFCISNQVYQDLLGLIQINQNRKQQHSRNHKECIKDGNLGNLINVQFTYIAEIGKGNTRGKGRVFTRCSQNPAFLSFILEQKGQKGKQKLLASWLRNIEQQDCKCHQNNPNYSQRLHLKKAARISQ